MKKCVSDVGGWATVVLAKGSPAAVIGEILDEKTVSDYTEAFSKFSGFKTADISLVSVEVLHLRDVIKEVK